MTRFTLAEIVVTDVARTPVATLVTPEDLTRSLLDILGANLLCSLATVSPDGAPHVNTMYFAYTDALEVIFLSHPGSQHCQNVQRVPAVALTVFASAQQWTEPGRGVQLFGTGDLPHGAAAQEAERCYGTRFPAFAEWKGTLKKGDRAQEYLLYRITITSVKVLDESRLGDARFVRAAVVRHAQGSSAA